MLRSIIAAALRQRLILIVVAVVLVGFGVNAAQHLSVDAFPDVANVQVQIATEAAGKSPEEVERFVTIPIEIAMTGLPGMTDMRSLNKPGLSLLTLVFTDESDLFRERQMISERMSELRERDAWRLYHQYWDRLHGTHSGRCISTHWRCPVKIRPSLRCPVTS